MKFNIFSMIQKIFKHLRFFRSPSKIELPAGTKIKITNGPVYKLSKPTKLNINRVERMGSIEFPELEALQITPPDGFVKTVSTVLKSYHQKVQLFASIQQTFLIAGATVSIGVVILKDIGGVCIDLEVLKQLLSQTDLETSFNILRNSVEYQAYCYIKEFKFAVARIFLPNNVSPLELHGESLNISVFHPVLNGLYADLLIDYQEVLSPSTPESSEPNSSEPNSFPLIGIGGDDVDSANENNSNNQKGDNSDTSILAKIISGVFLSLSTFLFAVLLIPFTLIPIPVIA